MKNSAQHIKHDKTIKYKCIVSLLVSIAEQNCSSYLRPMEDQLHITDDPNTDQKPDAVYTQLIGTRR